MREINNTPPHQRRLDDTTQWADECARAATLRVLVRAGLCTGDEFETMIDEVRPLIADTVRAVHRMDDAALPVCVERIRDWINQDLKKES